MALELNAAGDFAQVVDSVETLTLKRRESAATIEVAGAKRMTSRTSEAEPAGRHVAQADVVWQFAWPAESDRPRLGDTLIDSAGECFTILAIERLFATGRVRCETRNLRIVYWLIDRVDVQQAIWEDTGGGPEISDWATVHTALPARIQPDRMEVDHTTTPPTGTATYRITLGEQLDIGEYTRFVDPLGNVYQLIAYLQAERIDVLPVAVALRLGGT